jgi:hypothetical protein
MDFRWPHSGACCHQVMSVAKLCKLPTQGMAWRVLVCRAHGLQLTTQRRKLPPSDVCREGRQVYPSSELHRYQFACDQCCVTRANTSVMKQPDAARITAKAWWEHPRVSGSLVRITTLVFVIQRQCVCERVGKAITLWSRILEVGGSNLRWDTAYPDWSPSWFSKFPPDECHYRPLPITRQFIIPFCAVYSSGWTSSFNN